MNMHMKAVSSHSYGGRVHPFGKVTDISCAGVASHRGHMEPETEILVPVRTSLFFTGLN
jgi:hypothetical protein